jgi:uncharacterized coiled-coil protein SlyX
VSIALTNMVLELEKRVTALERTVSASPRSLANLLAQGAAKRAQGDELRAEVAAVLEAHPGQKAYAIRSYLTRAPLPSVRRVQQVMREIKKRSTAGIAHDPFNDDSSGVT